MPNIPKTCMKKTVSLSKDGRFRYSLGRHWDVGDTVGFIMLNPSTANDVVDDPTIRRCIAFAKSWGYSGLEVSNLFAYRTPYPRLLTNAISAIGDKNDESILAMAERVSLIVAAWGGTKIANGRADDVIGLLQDKDIYCLAINGNGSPKHPLYVKGDAHPVLLSGAYTLA